MVMVLLCVGCNAQSEESGSGGMFGFFKDKRAAKAVTTVHADVGSSLAREASFPSSPPTSAVARKPKQITINGSPAYVVEGSSGHAPLALVNINAGKPHIEIWELESDKSLTPARKKPVQLDPAQDSWSGYLLSGASYVSENQLVLGVYYYAPQVKQALFLYDRSNDSFTKIANVVPFTDDYQKFFEAQAVTPNAVIVKYYTGRIRISPEVYYNTPTHLRLFTARYPQGVELVQLSAADGSVERWAVLNKKLWLEARDTREPRQPHEYIWSLNLGQVLPN
jgi:hypothetical protein